VKNDRWQHAGIAPWAAAPPSCQMEQQRSANRASKVPTCHRHRAAYSAHAAGKMGVAQGGSGSPDGGHVHRSSLELGLLEPSASLTFDTSCVWNDLYSHTAHTPEGRTTAKGPLRSARRAPIHRFYRLNQSPVLQLENILRSMALRRPAPIVNLQLRSSSLQLQLLLPQRHSSVNSTGWVAGSRAWVDHAGSPPLPTPANRTAPPPSRRIAAGRTYRGGLIRPVAPPAGSVADLPLSARIARRRPELSSPARPPHPSR
jgi:hypothetical protein